MKQITWLMIPLLICHTTAPKNLAELYKLDFYKSMQENDKFFDAAYAQIDPTWQLVKKLFDKTASYEYTQENSFKIPYVFHLIWLGSAVPQRYYELKKQLEDFHPGCTVKLWTDTEAKTYPMKNRYAYEKTKNYGEKSDIWRYEILYNEGGVYLDGDFMILKPLTDLFYACDFFIGISAWRDFSLLNGLVGTCSGHPIMKTCMDNIQPVDRDLSTDSVMLRTGPWYITNCFVQTAQKGNFNNIALPSSFFYPWPHYIPFENNAEKIKALIKPYSLALHMYAGSWQWWSKSFGR